MPEDRVGRDVDREQTGRVGAETEEGGMSKGHDARIAKCEVEREREQDPDQDLGAEAEIASGHIEKNDDDRPRQCMADERKPTRAAERAEPGGRRWRGRLVLAERRHQPAAFDGSRPCGRHSNNTNTAAYSR